MELANEVRDSIEIVHTAEYANFLRHFFPVFVKLLQEVPPQTSSTPGERLMAQIASRCMGATADQQQAFDVTPQPVGSGCSTAWVVINQLL